MKNKYFNSEERERAFCVCGYMKMRNEQVMIINNEFD